MDNVTHAFLGAATAQSLFARQLGRWAWVAGALAANLPDVDVFVRTGNRLHDLLIHRTLTHSLLFIPLGTALVWGLLLAFKNARPRAGMLFVACLLAFATHCLLDSCTSYGTELFYPFSTARVAWDCMSIVDPVFTIVLIIGVVWAARRKSPMPARVVMVFAVAYISVGMLQHARGMQAQRWLAEQRHQAIDQGRVMPTIGNLIGWRSIYRSGGELYCDGLRLPIGAVAYAKSGEHTPVMTADDIAKAFPHNPLARDDFQRFAAFADGYTAAEKLHPGVIGDMRYSVLSDRFAPIWGIQLSAAPGAMTQFDGPSRTANEGVGAMWRDVVGNRKPYVKVGDDLLPVTETRP